MTEHLMAGRIFLALLMGLMVVKFIWLLYAVGRSLSEYRWEKNLDWGEFDPVQKATIEEEWRAQRQANPIKKVQQVLLGDLSRFGSELHFFRRCSTPYEILGCGIYESPVQIKKRYRLLVQKWHPDRLRGLGATDKEVLHATEILQIINGAYSILTAAKAA